MVFFYYLGKEVAVDGYFGFYLIDGRCFVRREVKWSRLCSYSNFIVIGIGVFIFYFKALILFF